MKRQLLITLALMSLQTLGVARDKQFNPAEAKGHLHFMENKGQVRDQNHQERSDIDFSIPGKSTSVFIGDGQLHYQFYKVDKQPSVKERMDVMNRGKQGLLTSYTTYRMDVELIGANKQAVVVKEEMNEYVQNYFTITGRKFSEPKKGAGGFQVHSYNKMTYKDIYPNIDWVIFVKGEQMEYEFVVREGGNPSDIQIKYNGATSLTKNANGSVTAKSLLGDVTEAAPYSFQRDGKVITSSFELNNNVLSFNVGAYTGELVIDPIVYWGTYYGGTGDDQYNSVQNDWNGELFAVGATTSIGNIATTGAFQQAYAGNQDAFITKFDEEGELVWSTYYGSTGEDYLTQGSVNLNDGSIYVCGYTNLGGTNDVLFANFSNTGAFVYDAVIGDIATNDIGNAVKVDNINNVIYFGGMTTSFSALGTLNSYHATNQGLEDGFLTKVDNNGNVVWSTYIGGSVNENVASITVNDGGDIFIAGTTNSTTGMTGLGGTLYNGGNYDAYIMRLTAAGNWIWGTYYGGAGDDIGSALEASSIGNNLILVGNTTSTSISNIGGMLQDFNGGGTDAFYTLLHENGSLNAGTFYGGSGYDAAYAISWDEGSNVIWGGYTESNDLLYTIDGFQPSSGGNGDGFLMRTTPLMSGFGWVSYYGGPGDEAVYGIAYNAGYGFYAAGLTNSTSGIAVNTNVQNNLSSGFDAFITRIEDCVVLPASTSLTGPTSVCAGSTQTYTASPIPGAIAYTWSLPGGWTGTSTTNTITVTVGTTSGQVTVMGNDACSNNGTATSLTVTVNAAPSANITAAGPVTFCQGSNVVLNSNTGLGYTYQWYQGTTMVGTNTSSYTATASGNYSIHITAGGCTTTSNIIAVTVNPAPNATASSNSPVCVGQTINLNGGSTTGGATFSWTGPNTFSSALEDPAIAGATAANAGTYTVTVTANGCTATATTSVLVTTGAPATPSAINGDISICAGSTNTYDVTNDPNAGSYTWTLPIGWTGSSTTNSVSATANASGGTISVTATNGCGTSAAATITVTVNPNPVAVITQSGNILNVTGTYASYQWYGPSGLIAGATNPSYTPTSSGNYYCQVTDANGCTDDSNPITITVSVNNTTKNVAINLYPNPNTGSFTIEGAFTSNDGKANIAIVDVAGRIVQTQEVFVNNNKLSVRIDMTSSLAAGVYTVKVSSDAANAVVPFVKN
jgi:hypothetical protein